ncbi:hypothetical protein EVAR_60579_1 [Eumeta japonica]|uniref:Uncharacterized protein n=1 Tax=Eumeta variegata TaxID=151549 RepID=A0A4C1YIG4_EUMVA|nr:hypothetical protein EVAR_60579_1 [Eumeta japonica]
MIITAGVPSTESEYRKLLLVPSGVCDSMRERGLHTLCSGTPAVIQGDTIGTFRAKIVHRYARIILTELKLAASCVATTATRSRRKVCGMWGQDKRLPPLPAAPRRPQCTVWRRIATLYYRYIKSTGSKCVRCGDASPCASDCTTLFSLDSMVLFTTRRDASRTRRADVDSTARAEGRRCEVRSPEGLMRINGVRRPSRLIGLYPVCRIDTVTAALWGLGSRRQARPVGVGATNTVVVLTVMTPLVLTCSRRFNLRTHWS